MTARQCGRSGASPLSSTHPLAALRCGDEQGPWLDARGHDSLCARPGVVGETAVNVGLAGRLRDQEHADAVVFAAGEGTGEQHETVVRETVHERGVVVDRVLLEGAFSVGPA